VVPIRRQPRHGHVARRKTTAGAFRLRLAALLVAIVLTVISAPLVASAQAPSLNWGSQVNPSRCPTDAGYRYMEINVTRKVDGDDALSDAINPQSVPWAMRDFNQHIQVWQVGVVGGGGERFCALVRYQGSFVTIKDKPTPGPSSGSFTEEIDGSFEGGYLLVFTADERASPTYKTQGHIGNFSGPIGLYDWIPFYFEHFNVDSSTIPTWWGWIYHGGNNGAWVNATDPPGNQGDITD
jgi:hypothetical protein